MLLSRRGEVAQHKQTALSSAAAFLPPTFPCPAAGLEFLPLSLEELEGYGPIPGELGSPLIFANISHGKGHQSFQTDIP